MSRTSVILEPKLREMVESRPGNMGEEINKSLNRYYGLIERCKPQLEQLFSENECSYMLDVTNGTLFEPWSIPYIVNELEDALPEYAEKWDIVDVVSFIEKLKETTLAQRWAMVDCIEQYWKTPNAPHGDLFK